MFSFLRIAFDPTTNILYNIETSGAALSWDQYAETFKKKFETADKYYGELFKFGYEKIEKIVICSSALNPNEDSIKKFNMNVHAKLITISQFIQMISEELKLIDPMKEVISESWMLLRTAQYFLKWV